MKATEVISTLESRGVTLWQEGSSLRYRAPAGVLTQREKSALKAHKASILKALAAKPSIPTATTATVPVAPNLAVTVPPVDAADKREAYEERAAILEYDANLLRQDAERKAAVCRYCRRWHGTKLGKGYCCIGFAPPVPRQAGDSCEQFTKEVRS